MKQFMVAAALAVCLAAFGADAGGDVPFASGYAKMDITPNLGTPLSGYYVRRISNGILDPLHARCVAVSDGVSKALIITVDNVHIANDMFMALRKAVSAATGVPLDAVFIACTHTHASPVTRLPPADGKARHWEMKHPEDIPFIKESNAIIEKGCVEASVKALADLAPTEILTGRGEVKGISFVRRYRMKDGTVRTNPEMNNPNIECVLGEPDEQLQLVRFVRKGKKEIAIVNFQCHPDTIGGYKFSADWPGLFRSTFEKAVDGTRCMFFNGAEGDVNHVNVNAKGGDFNDTFHDFDDVDRGYGHARHMGNVVAAFCTEGVEVKPGEGIASVSAPVATWIK